jgi:hypothetical protein
MRSTGAARSIRLSPHDRSCNAGFMIHYQLRCAADHEFDGWFRSSAAFEAQAADKLLACPRCADTRVTRAVMAPRIGKGIGDAPTAEAAAPEPVPEPAAAPGHEVAVTMPDELRAVLSRMRREIEQRCDYVGREFAAEARRIHQGETPARGIYGEASPAEAEALAEDGIEIARIPWVPRADS